jgi:hypothetical protein
MHKTILFYYCLELKKSLYLHRYLPAFNLENICTKENIRGHNSYKVLPGINKNTASNQARISKKSITNWHKDACICPNSQ